MNLYQKLSALHAALAAIPKYVKLNDAGKPLPLDADCHSAVLIPMANIIVWPHSLGSGRDNQESCELLCREFRAQGRDDWLLLEEWHWTKHIRDVSRRNPCVDTNFFPGIKPAGHWTKTALSGDPGFAWYVFADLGSVYYYLRNYNGFALAVRSAGQ